MDKDLGFVCQPQQSTEVSKQLENDDARTSKYPIYKQMLEDRNPIHQAKELRAKVEKNECVLLKPLKISRENSQLNTASYDSL